MKKYKEVLQKSMAKYVRNLRGSLSQEEMAEALHVSTRAYGDLERGEHFLSGMTLVFLILFIHKHDDKKGTEIRHFLKVLEESVQKAEKAAEEESPS